MRRVLLSIAGGLLIPILILMIGWMLLEVLDVQGPEWIGQYLFIPITWPLVLLGPLFPASDSAYVFAPAIRIILFFVAILFNILLYSALSYVILWRRANQKRFP